MIQISFLLIKLVCTGTQRLDAIIIKHRLFEISCIRSFEPRTRILWRVYPLLGNDSVNRFLWKQARANSRTSTARQWISKRASLTIEAVFSAWSFKSGYQVWFNWGQLAVRSWESSVEEEFVWESKKGIRLCKKEFICDLKYSEAAINPLPGYG
jgi:hypothetical protein